MSVIVRPAPLVGMVPHGPIKTAFSVAPSSTRPLSGQMWPRGEIKVGT